MKKYKVGMNEDLIAILTYINTAPGIVLWQDLIQHCIDYDLYIELYMNIEIITKLLEQHNAMVVQKNVQLENE